MAEGGWLPAAAATETAGTGAAGSASALSDVAASTPGAVLSAESPVPSRPAGAAGASSPAEVETATSVPALTVSPVPVVDGETAAPPIEPEAGAAEGLPEGAAVWASATNPPDNGTGVTTPAAEAAAALAWFYSRPPEPHPTRFSPSGLEATGAGPGMFASVTTTSPGPAATPGHSASSTVSTGGSRSPAFGGTEPTSAALLSPAAAARTPPTEGPGSETDRPGHKGSRAPDSPGESRTGGTPALAGGMSPPAFVAWGEEVGSPGPAETKGEGLAPRTSTGITGSDRTAPASQGVIAPTGVSGSTANEEPPGSAVEPSSRTHPWRTDAERSPAATEAPAAGHTGPWSRANSSPEPGPEMATPAWPGDPLPSPRTSGLETENAGFSLAGSSAGSPQPPSAGTAAPTAPRAVGDSLLPTPAAAAGRGDAAGSTPTAHKETATSPANTMPETRPSPAPAKASPAGRAELSPGERGAVAGARTTLYSSPGAVEATGLHAPAGDTSPAAMASPWETTAGPSAAQTEQLGSPTTSFLGSPSPSPQTVSRPAGTVNAAAFPASNSAVPRASRGPLTTPGVASSSAPSVLGSSSPSLHWEKGLTPPQQGANVGSADASHKSPATTSGPSGGWAETPAPLAGLTGLRELWLYSLASHERVKYPARCLAWLRMQHEPARWNKDWPACPCSLASGALDPRFRQSRGPAGVTVLYAASPKQHGTGVRCLYNSREELVKGWQDRAWKASGQRSPSHDPALALYAWCCGQPGSPQLCARYSPKRPEISCAGSRLPKPGPSSAEAESDSEEGRD
ncbi:uncharacterized protein LOC142018547 isoform X3 [Carettochelys insculpta]|uniref:uncharacterized protein LOC142018547 isoform X3 n=1 Tax=Carettochelys insculpta TaxID=44489 RepID=UPI003EBB8C7A